MHIARKWTILCATALVASFAFGGSHAKANVIDSTTLSYRTGGLVYTDSSVATKNPDIQFAGFNNGSIESAIDMSGSDTFSLGKFIISAPSDGESRDYLNAPFSIQLDIKNPVNGNTEGLAIWGHLDGTLTGGSPSTLHVTIDSIGPSGFVDFPPPPTWGPIFPYGELHILGPTDIAVGTNGGEVVMQAQIQVPEPSTFAILALAIGGLAIRRARRSQATRAC